MGRRQHEVGSDQHATAGVLLHKVEGQLPGPLALLGLGAPDDPGGGPLQTAL